MKVRSLEVLRITSVSKKIMFRNLDAEVRSSSAGKPPDIQRHRSAREWIYPAFL